MGSGEGGVVSVGEKVVDVLRHGRRFASGFEGYYSVM